MSKEPIYMRLHEGTLDLLKMEAKRSGKSQAKIVEMAVGLYLKGLEDTNPDVYTKKFKKYYGKEGDNEEID
jgi:hypothetical protein